MYGIPNQKLPKDVVKRRQELMEKEGVTFMTGVDVGRTLAAEEILKSFDAVALCCGAKQPRAVQAVNMDKAKGVIYAVDFLSSTTKSLLNDGLKEGSYVSAKGQDVVMAFHIFLFLIFAVAEVCPHTGNSEILVPAVQGGNAAILPLDQVAALVKNGFHGKLVMLKGKVLFGGSIVRVFRADMLERRQSHHLPF